MARNGLAKRTRRRARVKLAFRYLLPGQPHADPRTEPWSLGWLERLYDLAPALVSGDKPPRHNPAHSLAPKTSPECADADGASGESREPARRAGSASEVRPEADGQGGEEGATVGPDLAKCRETLAIQLPDLNPIGAKTRSR